MAKKSGGKEDKEQIRLQIVVSEEVAKEVERQARELNVSQAWVAGWGIRNTLRQKGLFSDFVLKRIKRPERFQRWATQTDAGKESRLTLRMDRDVVDKLETLATALNQSPLKLAGLMIENALESFGPSLFALKTTPGKFIRWLVQDDEDFKDYDPEEQIDEEAKATEGDGTKTKSKEGWRCHDS